MWLFWGRKMMMMMMDVGDEYRDGSEHNCENC